MCINEANINRQFKLTHSNQKTNHPANLSENYENHYVRIQIHSHNLALLPYFIKNSSQHQQNNNKNKPEMISLFCGMKNSHIIDFP